MSTFTCRRCRKRKGKSHLSNSGTGPRPACKECMAKYHRNWYRKNEEARLWERARNSAYGRALRKLKDRHPAEFERIYASVLRKA